MSLSSVVNPRLTVPRVLAAAAALAVGYGVYRAVAAEPRLAAEVVGLLAVFACAAGWFRAAVQVALRDRDATRLAAEVREVAVQMIDQLVAFRTAAVETQLAAAQAQVLVANEEARNARQWLGKAGAAEARAERLDLTGKFMAACFRWDRARKSKKAASVVNGITFDADYWWRQIADLAVERWPDCKFTVDQLAFTVETLVTEPDVRRWRHLASPEFSIMLPL